MQNGTRIFLGGAPEGYDARLVAKELDRGAPVIHVARDDKRLEAMRTALAVMAPRAVVLELPAWDCLPYDRVSPNPEISARRMATLAALAHGMPGAFVLLTTLNAATQRIPAREVLRAASFSARVGDRVDEGRLRSYLARMGFSLTDTVTEPGDYAIRGGIVDIYPPGVAGPVRLDFFGDVLDGARRFDPETQRTVEKLDLVELAPVSEVMLDEGAITRFRQNYRIEFGAAGTDDPLYEAVSAGRKHQGMEHWLPFFHARLETLFDYLPEASVMLDDQVTPARISRWEGIADQYDARREAMTAKGRLDTVYKPAAPDLLYLDEAAWEAAVAGHRVIQLSPLAQSPGPGVLDAGGRMGRSFAPERQAENISLFGALVDHVRSLREDRQVVIASWSEGARERLKGLLEEAGLQGTKLAQDIRDVPEARGGTHLMVWALEQGFTAPGLAVISEQDVLGDRLISKPKKRRKAENFLREHDTLTPGDLVVHVEHGVGRYMGLETLRVPQPPSNKPGPPHDYLHLVYAEGREALPAGREYRASEPLRARRGAARQAGRRGVAGQEGAPQGADPRDCRAAHADRGRAAPAPCADPRGAAFAVGGLFGPLPLSGDGRPAVGHRGCGEGPRIRQPDGPARGGRCGLRQDRGRDAGGLRGGIGGHAGGRHLPDHASRPSAFPQLCRALPRLSDESASTVALRLGQGGGRDAVGPRRRHGGYLHRHPCASGQGREAEEPRAPHHRRGAAFRRVAQGAAEGDALRGPCADADRDAHPADAATVADRRARSVDHRDAARGPARHPHLRLGIRYCDDPRGAPARAVSGRAELLRRPAALGSARHGGLPARPCARGLLCGGARPAGGGRARRADECLLRWQVRRASGHDHRRVGPRHPDRQHDDRPSRRHVRPEPALSDPRPGGPGQDAGLLLSHDEAARLSPRRRSSGCGCSPPSTVSARASISPRTTSTCAARATSSARNSRVISRRWATSFTSRCWRRRSRRSARASCRA